MTKSDIEHLAQVTHSLWAIADEEPGAQFHLDDFERFIDRMLWAIHASADTPHFDEAKFRDACRGEGSLTDFIDA